MRLIAALIVLLSLALPAAARPLSEEETASLAKAVDSYIRATSSGDAVKIVKAIPPRILNIFAGSAGIEAKKLEKTLVDQTEVMTKGVKISDASAVKEGLNAEDAVLADGTPVTWVVVPTAFTAETGGKTTRNEQPLLALSEGGKWYFMRLDGAQQEQLAAIAYPFLADAEIPDGTVTPMN